jgi:hypothetical protein
MSALLEDFSDKLRVETKTLLRKHGEAVEKRFDAVEERLQLAADDSRAIWKAISELRTGLNVAESVEPVKADDNSFHRDIDATIIRINLAELVSKVDVHNATKSWLDGVAANGWEITGDEVGKKFTIAFRGQNGLASSRCSKALGFLRKSDGSWTRFKVGHNELYLSPDKNPAQQKTEMQVKRLKKAFCAATGAPPAKIFASRRDGFISIDFVPIAKVFVSQHADTVIRWNMEAITARNVNKEAVVAKFLETAASSQVEWNL